MNKYELNYIVNPDSTEESLEELSNKVAGFIAQEGGSIIKKSKPEKRRLGYSIKEKKEGFLVSIEFSAEPDKIAAINKKAELEKEIIRKMIVLKPEEKEIQIEDNSVKEARSKKVELENIDEKIDEILK